MHNGVEGQPISPAGGEVVHIDVGVPINRPGKTVSRSRPWSATRGRIPSVWFLEPIRPLLRSLSASPPPRPRSRQPHPAVFIWHHSSKASLADFFSLLSSVSTLMSWICEGRKAFTPWTGPPGVPGGAQRYTESGNGSLDSHNCRSGAESGDLSSWASDHTTSGQREVR